eukprot:m.278495 g.278495  ORF g.278495 m.278495 type:complete len:84 (-) comp137248_c0_seq1:69-320(-)
MAPPTSIQPTPLHQQATNHGNNDSNGGKPLTNVTLNTSRRTFTLPLHPHLCLTTCSLVSHHILTTPPLVGPHSNLSPSPSPHL